MVARRGREPAAVSIQALGTKVESRHAPELDRRYGSSDARRSPRWVTYDYHRSTQPKLERGTVDQSRICRWGPSACGLVHGQRILGYSGYAGGRRAAQRPRHATVSTVASLTGGVLFDPVPHSPAVRKPRSAKALASTVAVFLASCSAARRHSPHSSRPVSPSPSARAIEWGSTAGVMIPRDPRVNTVRPAVAFASNGERGHDGRLDSFDIGGSSLLAAVIGLT